MTTVAGASSPGFPFSRPGPPRRRQLRWAPFPFPLSLGLFQDTWGSVLSTPQQALPWDTPGAHRPVCPVLLGPPGPLGCCEFMLGLPDYRRWNLSVFPGCHVSGAVAALWPGAFPGCPREWGPGHPCTQLPIGAKVGGSPPFPALPPPLRTGELVASNSSSGFGLGTQSVLVATAAQQQPGHRAPSSYPWEPAAGGCVRATRAGSTCPLGQPDPAAEALTA